MKNTGRVTLVAIVFTSIASCTDDPVGVPLNWPSLPSVSPAPNAINANVSNGLTLQFVDPLEAVDLESIIVFGRWSGVHPTAAVLAPDGMTLQVTPVRAFSAGEQVTVSIPRGALRDPTTGDPAPSFSWTFWSATTQASLIPEFTGALPVRSPDDEPIQTYGAYGGDLDGDGWSDLVLPNEKSNDLRIFMNDGAGGYGAFTSVPFPSGGEPSTNEGADFDGDGDIDLAVGGAHGEFITVYEGDGLGGLAAMQELQVADEVRGLCLADLEGDGAMDIVAASPGGDAVYLYRNTGTGSFAAAGSVDAGLGEWSCATADMNSDGLMDVVVGGRGSLTVTVLLSRGDGTLRPGEPLEIGGDPWMLAAGDMDGDGHADIVSVNASSATLAVVFGDGRGGLGRVTRYAVGGFPLAVDAGDLDGDGDLDVVASDFLGARFVVFENRGGGVLEQHPEVLTAPQAGSCAILHDRDNDGDLDTTGIDEKDDVILLYENR